MVCLPLTTAHTRCGAGTVLRSPQTLHPPVDTHLATRWCGFCVGTRYTSPSIPHQIDFSAGGTRQVYIYYYYTPGSTQAPSQTTSTGSATLLITMRGCPEGFNPNTDDFFANCTIPLDAPDASFLYHGGDGQGGMNIMWMDRQYDGAYIFNAGPNTMNVQLSGLAPTERDAYTVIGHNGESGGGYNINLVNGETRQVHVFYYYWP